jgi:hypothetical protein
MHFLCLVSLLAATPSLASFLTDPKPITQCNLRPSIKGAALQEKQDAAVKDFAHIFIVEKDPKKAWDKYVPGCGSLKFGPLSPTDAMPFQGVH